MYVVGGHGYVGSRVVSYAAAEGIEATVVSREGDTRNGVASVAWPAFLSEVESRAGTELSIIWLLDGAKHGELNRLDELVNVVDGATHIAAVSSCTVYGDRQGRPCDEDTPIELLTDNARLKAAGEDLLRTSPATTAVFRLGALYGVDLRGVRRDRVEKWVTEAATHGTVTVPEPAHWRGWLHRDQAARSLFRGAQRRISGTFNIATSNFRFVDAANFAALLFGAKVRGDGHEDPLNYQVGASRARERGLLDELPSESLQATVAAFAETRAGHP